MYTMEWGGGGHSVKYFPLLPLPESLELVLDPDPELELSPSLELSELLLSLSRDTCPSTPNKICPTIAMFSDAVYAQTNKRY